MKLNNGPQIQLGRRLGGIAVAPIASVSSGSTHYLNTGTGNDANDGLTPSTAVQSFATAITKWIDAGRNGTIYITAPESTPVAAPHQLPTLTEGTLTLRGLNGAAWYSINGFNRNSGWADQGGGVWSRGGITSYEAFASIEDPLFGDYTHIGYAGATTTPAEGKLGVVSGVVYIHLPGGVSPNSLTRLQMQIFSRTYQIPVGSTLNLTIRDMIHRFSSTEAAVQLLGGTLTARDCEFQYACGIEVRNDAIGRVYDSISWRSPSDGFDARGTSRLELHNCEVSYSWDEGASPHDTSTLIVNGGRYHHNGRSGIAAVNGSTFTIDGATFDFNGTGTPEAGIEQGHGVAFAQTASGTLSNCTLENNVASGIYNISTGEITFTSNTSQNNGDADVGV